MKTLKEYAAIFNEGKLYLPPPRTKRDKKAPPQTTRNDIKQAILGVYRHKGLEAAQRILAHFQVSCADELRESQYPQILDMCEK